MFREIYCKINRRGIMWASTEFSYSLNLLKNLKIISNENHKLFLYLNVYGNNFIINSSTK